MERSLTRFCLAAVGVLMLVATSGTTSTDRPRDPADMLRELGVPDSIAERWTQPYIPLWALTQEAPVVGPEGPVGALTRSATTDCPPSLTISLASTVLAHHFDSARSVSELYNRDYDNKTVRYDIAADLSYTVETIPVDFGSFWLVEDLDRDGDVEFVVQYWDSLLIRSWSDGAFLGEFGWPGFNVEMNPTLVNIDDDPYLEIYVTPTSLGGSSHAVLIDFDSVSGLFEVIADLYMPGGAVGQPAVGDFDEDGRFEFISGNNNSGYELFEWQDPFLVHIGMVGDTTYGNNFSAVACRPKPGGLLHALVGESSGGLFRYQLLAPTGDNTFEVVHVFQENTGFIGIQPCRAADTDCDGLDEMVMCFHPMYRVWEWSDSADAFIEDCVWSRGDFGSMAYWYVLDLDQNRTAEWGVVNDIRDLFVFPDPACVYCDTLGVCPAVAGCFCACAADPACDGQVDVLDVVSAVDVAFRSGSPAFDPFPQCPVERTDVDCSGFTNVLDVVHIVNVAFRSGDPASEFCQPCP